MGKRVRTVDPSKEIAEDILVKNIRELSKAALGEDAAIHAEVDVYAEIIHKITLTFCIAGNSEMSIALTFYDDDDTDHSMVIECEFRSQAFFCYHLSAYNGARYSLIARGLGLPTPLDQIAHMTEFCVALVAPLFGSITLAPYIECTNCVERDGISYYTGHGGMMRAMYPLEYAEKSSFSAGSYYTDDASDDEKK